jgi:hypothetical protein
LHDGVADVLDLRHQLNIPLWPGADARGVKLSRCMKSVRRRGEPQNVADRLDLKSAAVLIDERLGHFSRRSMLSPGRKTRSPASGSRWLGAAP